MERLYVEHQQVPDAFQHFLVFYLNACHVCSFESLHRKHHLALLLEDCQIIEVHANLGVVRNGVELVDDVGGVVGVLLADFVEGLQVEQDLLLGPEGVLEVALHL